MALRWGFSTLGCPEAGLMEALALAREFAFQAVEVRFLDGMDDLNASLERFLAVPGNGDKAVRSGVDIQCLNTSFKLTTNQRADMDALKKSAHLADALRARYLRVFDGGEVGEELTPERRDYVLANYREWKRWRERNGVKAELALETHGATSSTDNTLKVFEVLRERIPVIWDLHHTLILGGEKPEDTWNRLGDSVVEVHVKDSVDKTSARHPYTYVLPGQGRIPVKEVLRLLERRGFSGLAVLEWERKWHPYLPPLREAIRAMDAAGWRE